jgi:hypothetical protein
MIHQRLSATIGINSTLAESVFIGEAKRVYLEVQTFANGLTAANANLYAQVAHSEVDVFRRLHDMGVYSAASGIYAWETPSGAGNAVYLCRPAAGYNYLKIEASVTATAALTCYVNIVR